MCGIRLSASSGLSNNSKPSQVAIRKPCAILADLRSSGIGPFQCGARVCGGAESPDHGLGDEPTKTVQQVLAGTHPDVTVLATNKVTIGIDEVRDIITTSEQMPSTGAVAASSLSKMSIACWNAPPTCCSRRLRSRARTRFGSCARRVRRMCCRRFARGTRIVNLARAFHAGSGHISGTKWRI